MIKNIIFDFGGVLLDWNPRYVYSSYFNDNAEMEHFLKDICSGTWNAELDKGRPFDEAVEELAFEYPEYSEAIFMYRDRWPEMLGGEIPEGVGLLRELKGKGYSIYGLTNWSAETIGIPYSRHDFFNLFSGIVVSGEEKLIKPDPEIYRILLDRYALKAGESVFIDDNTGNVKAAISLGISGILYDNIENVRSRLEALLK